MRMEHADRHSILYIREMCCADEQATIEKKLRTLPGVKNLKFNLVARKLYITHSIPADSIVSALKAIGFAATTFSNEVKQPQPFFKKHYTAIATSMAAFVTLSGAGLSAIGVDQKYIIPLFVTAVIVGGWKIALKGWKAAAAFSLDMNALMTIAVLGAMAIGKWEEGAAVIVLFALAQLLEEMSMRRTRRALSSVLELAPTTATVRRNFFEVNVPTDKIDIGDIVVIRPGEKIPVDGEVVKGHSFVNQSAITGESVPVEKKIGSAVYAGTINEQGSLEIKTTKAVDDTALAHIVHLVEEAQAQRSPSQDFVDRFAKVYTPVVLGMAVFIAVASPLFFAQTYEESFYRALVLLVIACPCALVISTPVAIVSGLTAAARQGILIKGGRYLEEAAKVKAMLIDKTGTLTYGVPSVTNILQLNSVPAREILRIAALGEMKSEHSLGRAIVTKAEEEGVDLTGNVDHFESIAGRGIVVRLNNREYTIGNHQLVEERGLCSVDIEAQIGLLEAEGKTTIIVCSQSEVLGIIGVADTIRTESRHALRQLKKDGVQKIVMLSGDSNRVARSTASSLGIDECFGELMPADKVALAKEMRSRYETVAMVGDGINDAPALAASSLGIAMGVTGTDIALETADVVLMQDDLSKISSLILIGKKSMTVLKQNVALALAAKGVFLFLAVFGFATLWMAVIADDGVTLLVVLNSLRLLRQE
jgi:Cd2+/Zn2+-exporting ATPase